jgi:hypothetical protein
MDNYRYAAWVHWLACISCPAGPLYTLDIMHSDILATWLSGRYGTLDTMDNMPLRYIDHLGYHATQVYWPHWISCRLGTRVARDIILHRYIGHLGYHANRIYWWYGPLLISCRLGTVTKRLGYCAAQVPEPTKRHGYCAAQVHEPPWPSCSSGTMTSWISCRSGTLAALDIIPCR